MSDVPKDDEKALSTYGMGECENCCKWRRGRLYMLQMGNAAFVCDPCRRGEKE